MSKPLSRQNGLELKSSVAAAKISSQGFSGNFGFADDGSHISPVIDTQQTPTISLAVDHSPSANTSEINIQIGSPFDLGSSSGDHGLSDNNQALVSDSSQYSLTLVSDEFTGSTSGPGQDETFTNVVANGPSPQGGGHAGGDSDAASIFSESHNSGSHHGGTTTTSSSSGTVTSGASGGLVINVTYDSSVGTAPSGFKTVVGEVVQFFESHFNDPITINIDVGYGEVAGTRLGPGALGESETYLSSLSYSQLTSALAADAKDSIDTSAVASLPSTDPTGGNYWISTAEGKALGLIAASSSVDGYAGFSSSSGIFDYNNTDGVSAGQYDFFGVVAHEISEVMGRMLLVGGTIGTFSNSYDILDLFHYSSSGVHDFSGSIAGYFSVDGGHTDLNTFNTASGGDAGDWAGATIDAFNAFANSGVVLPISSADLTALDAIGWDATSSSPPPALPDLTVSNVSVPVAQVTSSGMTIDFHVNNVGTADATSAFNTEVGLFSDSALTHEVAHFSSISLSSLSAGSSVAENIALSLTAPSTAGTYYIGIIADSGHTITEGNESNNAAEIPVILGTSGTESLSGTSGIDMIFGFDGNDTIYGGSGTDVLSGGTGSNHFLYKATTDGGSSGDLIVDFTPSSSPTATTSDVLDFTSSAFGKHLATGGANTGTLNSSHFVSGDTEGAFSARGAGFWFDTNNHTLYYDSNGNNAGGQIAMAQLENGAAVTHTDIHLV